jgi:PAS domain S-box-containing protein
LSQQFNPRHLGTARTVFFFVVLTMALTGIVILAWEKIFLRPVYSLVEDYYPGAALQERRTLVQQRIEHFVISVTVDAVVVTILLAVVRRQQRELSKSEEQYRLLFEGNPEPMWVSDNATKRFVSVNEAALALYGYQRREFLTLLREDVCAAPEAAIPANDGSSGAPVEFHRRKDGTTFAVESSSHEIEFEGRPSTLVLVRDVTERRAAETAMQTMQSQLERNERVAALGRAAAQVAHEVKNPLAGLRLYSLHLKTRTQGKLSEAESAMVDKIVEGIARLSTTTEQILNFARPVDLKLQSVELHQLINDVLQILEPQIHENHISLDRKLAPEPLPVRVDEAAMHGALLNLALNAVQAMAEGGKLTVETRSTGTRARLVIRDTGQGMTGEQVAHVFEPFYTTKSQGMGLGMPYAKKIIEQHSGTIVVNSQPGTGTEIAIELGL